MRRVSDKGSFLYWPEEALTEEEKKAQRFVGLLLWRDLNKPVRYVPRRFYGNHIHGIKENGGHYLITYNRSRINRGLKPLAGGY